MTDDKADIIRIMCPNLGCQRILAVPPRAQGRVVRCQGCGTNIRIPRPETHDSAASAALAGRKHAA